MSDAEPRDNFIVDIIERDVEQSRHDRVVTRFPPEPNGYPHIGHAKSICLNFSLARRFGGRCHLRFDDTNPEKESMEYVEAMKRDIAWLGFDWGEHLYFASDYFEWLYERAVELIDKGLAYVDSLDEETMRAYRGTVTEPGRPSPHRDRSVEENLDLFRRMRAGEFDEGAHVLRAKIDMSAANMKMRDPALYRIKKAHHYRRGDDWVIYPLYDFTHCLSDAKEQITHSICTLEFENNREIYDWVLEHLDLPPYESGRRPHQYEFARLNLSHTLMSKRKLLALVEQGVVTGWDDPRMPTLSGMRRRGFTPASIRAFADMIGVAKNNSLVDLGKLEFCIREDLNDEAPRVMCVLKPLKVVIENYPEGETETFESPLFPPDVDKPGIRPVTFSRELYIERDDFMKDPPKKYYRLSPGAEVRLRYAYIVKCERVIENEAGEVVELRCSYDPDTKGGKSTRKVRGTIHWVSASDAVDAEVRLYDRLFLAEQPADLDEVNPDSLKVVVGKLEAAAPDLDASHLQFERQGYFVRDADGTKERPVFNLTVTLKDSWAKQTKTAPQETARAKPVVAPGPVPVTREIAPADRTAADALQNRHDGLDADDALRLVREPRLASLFEAATATAPEHTTELAKWTLNEVAAATKDHDTLAFDGAALAELIALVADETISTRAAKAVLAQLVAEGGSPRAIVEAQGLGRMGDDALAQTVGEVLAKHSAEVERYRGGEKKLLGFLLGQVMRAAGGRADAKTTRQVLVKTLDD